MADNEKIEENTENRQVSLPGAGETEPTVLEELNRNIVNRLLHQQTSPSTNTAAAAAGQSHQTKSLTSSSENQPLTTSGVDNTTELTDNKSITCINSNTASAPLTSDNNSNLSDLCQDNGNNNKILNNDNATEVIEENFEKSVNDDVSAGGQNLQNFLKYENKSENSVGDNKIVSLVVVEQQGQINSSSRKCNGDDHDDDDDDDTTRTILTNLCENLNKIDNQCEKLNLSLENNNYQNDNEEILNFNLQTVTPDSDLSESLANYIVAANTTTNTNTTSSISDYFSPVASESSNLSVRDINQNVCVIASQSLIRNRLSNERELSPPPVPLSTYRWEELRRSKEKGGYPWTYLESPDSKSVRKKFDFSAVPILDDKLADQIKQPESNDSIIIKETNVDGHTELEETVIILPSSTEEKSTVVYENYIQEEQLDDDEQQEGAAAVAVAAPTKSDGATKDDSTETNRATSVIKSILKRAHPKKFEPTKSTAVDEQPAENSPKKTKCCHPFVDKLKTMADKQLHKVSAQHKRFIKKTALGPEEKIMFPPEEKQQILKLKESPKAERKEIASYIVKQDSDDVLEITELDESPSGVRKRRDEDLQINGNDDDKEKRSSIVIPDEIIEIPNATEGDPVEEEILQKSNVNEISAEKDQSAKSDPPPKAPRKKREHVYEEIPDEQSLLEAISEGMHDPVVSDFLGHISLRKEDENVASELLNKNADHDKNLLQPIASIDSVSSDDEKRTTTVGLLAPLSSIDSTSSDDERKIPLPALQEESDQGGCSDVDTKPEPETSVDLNKKVKFSASTENNDIVDETHREDVELPDNLQAVNSRWSKMR